MYNEQQCSATTTYNHSLYRYVCVNNPHRVSEQQLKAWSKEYNRYIKLIAPRPIQDVQLLDYLDNKGYKFLTIFINPVTHKVTLTGITLEQTELQTIFLETGYYIVCAPAVTASISIQLEQLYKKHFKTLYAFRQKHTATEVQQTAQYLLFTSLGGAQEIGRSCYLLRTNNTKIMIDVGIGFKQNQEYPYLKHEISNIDEINALIITHPHLDHVGSIVHLVNSGYKGPIYMTHAGLKFTYLTLLDSFNLFEGTDAIKYTLQQVHATLLQVIVLDYEKVYHITRDISIRLKYSCHILGGCMIEYTVNNKLYLFTSDFSTPTPGTELLKAFNLHRRRYVKVISEGTNITKEKSNQSLDHILLAYIQQAKDNYVNLLMPTLLIGRGQELLYRLIRCMRLNPALRVPIYIDSSIAEITKIYREHTKELSAIGYTFVTDPELEEYITILTKETKQLPTEVPGIIIAPSGMLEGGNILSWIIRYIEDPKVLCVLSCYQAHDTLGGYLASAVPGQIVKIKYKSVTYRLQLNMQVYSISKYFGAHITRSDLLSMLKTYSRSAPIIIHTAPSSTVLRTLKSNYIVPANLETIRLL